jgi:hypothetical protein
VLRAELEIMLCLKYLLLFAALRLSAAVDLHYGLRYRNTIQRGSDRNQLQTSVKGQKVEGDYNDRNLKTGAGKCQGITYSTGKAGRRRAANTYDDDFYLQEITLQPAKAKVARVGKDRTRAPVSYLCAPSTSPSSAFPSKLPTSSPFEVVVTDSPSKSPVTSF